MGQQVVVTVTFSYMVWSITDGASVGNYSSEDSDDESVGGTVVTVDEPDVSSNTIVHDYASVVDGVRWVIRM